MAALDVTIPTGDGNCKATLHVPETVLPAPAVILYPDAGGARDTFSAMGYRLASLGYVVLVPDVFYRTPYEPFSMETVFSDDGERERLFTLMNGLTPEMSIADADAFLEFLAGRPEVRPGGVGTTGYCMGGRISLTVAGHHPDRITAAASFHGGNLAPDGDPASPHLLAGKTKATVYVGAAENDGSFPDDQRGRLQAAYDAAGVTSTIETYPALHGYAVADNPTYDETAAERHWKAMEQLYGSVLTGR
jgi:carboxymethylenebutenolidase